MEKYERFFEDEDTDNLEEKITWKYVVRDGKRVRKPSSDKPGMRIDYTQSGSPKEVRMSGSEKTKLSRQNVKTARKTKSKAASTTRKRNKSVMKHTWGN